MSDAPITVTADAWDARYRSGDLPWDLGRPSPELVRVLDEYDIAPCQTIELGCGTGVNAVELASRGFQVTAVDLAPTAIERARQRAQEAGAAVDFTVANVLELPDDVVRRGPFDFVFDRGCYHSVRRVDCERYLQTLQRLTRTGTRYLSLSGNPNEENLEGPPRVAEQEIRGELGRLFGIVHLRTFRFTNPDGSEGPLAWSCLMTRRSSDDPRSS